MSHVQITLCVVISVDTSALPDATDALLDSIAAVTEIEIEDALNKVGEIAVNGGAACPIGIEDVCLEDLEVVA